MIPALGVQGRKIGGFGASLGYTVKSYLKQTKVGGEGGKSLILTLRKCKQEDKQFETILTNTGDTHTKEKWAGGGLHKTGTVRHQEQETAHRV